MLSNKIFRIIQEVNQLDHNTPPIIICTEIETPDYNQSINQSINLY